MKEFTLGHAAKTFGLLTCTLCGCGVQEQVLTSDPFTTAVLGSATARETTTIDLSRDPLTADPVPVNQLLYQGDALPYVYQPWPVPMPLPTPEPGPSPFGTWVLNYGAMLPGFINGVDVTAFVMDQLGLGRVYLRDRATNAIDCVRILTLYDGDTLVVDFSFEANLPLGLERTFFFPVVVAEDDALGLAGEAGQIAWFTRVTQVPPDLSCGDLVIAERFDGLPNPNFFSDLVYFADDLMYNSSNNQIERFDLATNALDAPLAPTNNRLLQTVQGAHFWTHCACGGSPDAFRRNLVSVFDTVNSQTELGTFITIRAMAYETTTDLLWIHGWHQSLNRPQFTIVDTSGEPDVPVRTLPFSHELRALAFDGLDMWGIATMATQSVVRFDVTTGQVFETYEIPDEDVTWGGLTFDDANMYLLGSDAAHEGVIVRIPRL